MDILLALLLFNSTYVNYYVPQPHYVPVFTQKGDFSINSGIFHQQVGYAFTDYLGIYASRYRQNQYDLLPSETDRSWDRKVKANWHSLGLIPFRDIGGNTIFSIPFSFGWGKINGNHSYSSQYSYYSSFNTKCQFFNIQPTFLIKKEKFFDISLFCRYSLYHSKVISTYLDQGKNGIDEFDKYIMNNESFFDFYIDNGIQYRYGIKNLKCYAQVSSLSYKKTGHKLNQNLSFRTGLLINLNTHNLYRKINPN